MRILALIPARGGSKRLPGKNIRALGGRPLIAWSIEAARGVPGIADILVSTDDEEIAAASREHGAMVPWLRPAELATDDAGSAAVCVHALDWYEAQFGKVDGLLLLQPTSPFRGQETVLQGLALYQVSGFRRVVSFSPAASHPMWCVRVEEGKIIPFVAGGGFGVRSQDLPAAYTVNGALYLISPATLRNTYDFVGDDVVPLLMEGPELSIDIDTEFDWLYAEAVLASGAIAV
ncbi:cytidylyltransferase domain-containing protein [Dechloromonas denitrificans]|uniref:acylneuraminate cytidylyltransferase family protein n=1 Tax=Dechloromonas denitrificans TaxID=281362 RepID=UPI001CFA8092|nr:acylneuraminate cytidylyltransferase family protein [Dechloromonas denitrificans]UCV06677.1 acylneuraminate cytidylyltransferase family protein [Dechloromonas denitrificans]